MSKRKASTPIFVQSNKAQNTGSLVSIVIPVFNRFDLLERCVASIPEAFAGIPYDVILVDNASTERDTADEFYASLKHKEIIIRNKQNLGFSKACNLGAKRTRSPLIFLLNSDVILDPGSGEKLVKEMDDQRVGICGMKLVFGENVGLNTAIRPEGRLQHIGLSFNIRAEVYHAFVGWEENHPKVMSQKDVWAVTGAALMVRRSIWNKTGGLYEGYGFGTYEDVDLCMSAREMGYNITVVPEARGIHYVGATSEKYKVPYPMKQNYMLFMNRWQEKLSWWDGKIL